MNLGIFIPLKNYVSGLIKLLNFFEQLTFNKITHVIIFDDHTDARYSDILHALANELTFKFKILRICNSGNSVGLKWGLCQIPDIAKGLELNLGCICESDAVPNSKTFYNLVDTFKKYEKEHRLASTSPIYTWKDRVCYPTNPNWFKHGHGNCYHQWLDPEFGNLTMVDAVPFLFSLWNPYVFDIIGEDFPTFMHLDTKVGEALSKEGWRHIRLLDYSIIHEGGGRKSRTVKIDEDLQVCKQLMEEFHGKK